MEWIWTLFFGANIILLFLGLFVGLIVLVAYLLTAIGLFQAGKRRGMANPWLAFIPVLRLYLVGLMLGQEVKVTRDLKIPYLQYVLPGVALLSYLGSGSALSGIFGLALFLLTAVSFTALFKLYRQNNALLFGIFMGIPVLSIVGSFYVLRLGNLPAPDPTTDTTVFP